VKYSLLSAAVVASALIAAPTFGKGSSSSGHSHSSGSSSSHDSSGLTTHHASSGSGHHSSTYAPGVPRDSHGHIKRSTKAKDDFKHGHPCPSTGKTSGSCPGYVVDHVKPLKRGGADKPENMQWQTVQAAKAKDKVE